MKRIALFGSTGSIGTQTFDIIKMYPEKFKLTACFANKNIDLLVRQADELFPSYIGLYDFESNKKLKSVYNGKSIIADIHTDNINEILLDVDIVVVAISGFVGIGITLDALKLGKTVAIATKEVLVSAGEIVKNYIKKYNGKIIPIDSEHSAIWQCLEGINKNSNYKDHVQRLILTASGGPFRTWSKEQLIKATLEDALKHPNWSMGAKITIDSATMMNKGLEVIEAQRLYDISADKIDILVHPQSIVHSMVECIDGNIIAQLGNANMRHPILYALSYPDRFDTRFGRLDLTKAAALTFEEPDFDKFPSMSLAYTALRMGGVAPAILNAANEKAVELFLNKKIGFMEISQYVQCKMNELCNNYMGLELTLDMIMDADKKSRC